MMKNVVGVVLLAVLALGCPPAKDTEAPTVSLAASATAVIDPAPLSLTATATDDQGVTRVDFYDGELKLNERSTPPYAVQLALTEAHNGTHRYTARAFDAAGNEATSDARSVVVDIDRTVPVVSLTASTTNLLVAGPVTLTANANDNKAITKVEFFEGNTLRGEDLSAPYTLEVSFVLADNGGHIYSARASDPSGNEATSLPLIVNVAIATPPGAPLVGLTFPLKTLRFSWPSVAAATSYRLFLDVDGAGSGGFVQVGADILGTSLDLPVALHRTNLAQAKYHLKACNDAGCSAASNELSAAAALIEAIGYVKASDPSDDSQFGKAVALSADGNTLAVSGKIQGPGAVYLFTRAATGTWTQQARLQASNPGFDDLFGAALALSDDGHTLAVGAYGEDSAATAFGTDPADNTATDAGSVYVFRRAGTVWTQQAWLKASNTGATDNFGVSVALSADGNFLAVGAQGESSNAVGIDGDQANDSRARAGAVYLFARAGSIWSQQTYLKASNSDLNDGFGGSVALSADGNTLAVGAPEESSAATGSGGNQSNNSAAYSGAVYVFTRNVSWSQQAYLKASNTGPSDNFGVGLALSRDGNTLVVGAPGEDSGSTGIDPVSNETAADSGAVYVFTRSGSSWAQQAWLKAHNPRNPAAFGRSVSLSSDGALLAVGSDKESSADRGVGADGADDTGYEIGAVYVFARTGTTWRQQAYAKPAHNLGTISDRLGHSVSLSADGNTLAAGAHHERSSATGIGGDQLDTSIRNAGAVLLY